MDKFVIMAAIFVIIIVTLLLARAGLEVFYINIAVVAGVLYISTVAILVFYRRNKGYLSGLADEEKGANEIISKQPDINRIRVLATFTFLFLLSAVYLINVFMPKTPLPIKPLILSCVIIAVSSSFFGYYAKWLQSKRGLENYGKTIQNLKVTGKGIYEWCFYGLMTGIMLAIVMVILLL